MKLSHLISSAFGSTLVQRLKNRRIEMHNSRMHHIFKHMDHAEHRTRTISEKGADHR